MRAGAAQSTASVPYGGVPGQHQDYHIITNDNDPAGKSGNYRVIFTLARVLQPDFHLDAAPDAAGDSYITIPTEAGVEPTRADLKGTYTQLRIQAKTDEGDFTFAGHANSKGRLSRLEVQLPAASFRDASDKSWRALSSALSDWSAQLDVPVQIGRVHITEIVTGSIVVSWIAPYQDTPLAIRGAGVSPRAYRGFASLYREALNSNSPEYQFLCLFKIVEGLRRRRERKARDAKKARQEPAATPHEQFPNDRTEFVPWLNAVFHVRRGWDDMALDSYFPTAVRGRRFTEVIDEILGPLRDDLAHALLEGERSRGRGKAGRYDDEELGHSLDLARASKVLPWIPVITVMVRRMLKNDIPEYLSFLKEDGSVEP